MELSGAKIASIRLARPQVDSAGPDAIFEFEFSFDGPGDILGPEIRMVVPIAYDESLPVRDLKDAALTAVLALLGDLSQTDRSQIENLLRDDLAPSSFS